MKKRWNTAPLPFIGQKRRFLRQFRQQLEAFPDDATYLDLFGGSGLLSHTVRQCKPNAKVVYNDYDGYSKRLAAIPLTNQILSDLRAASGEGYERNKRIESNRKDVFLRILKDYSAKYTYIDWMSLSASFLFSGKYAKTLDELTSASWYNKIRKSNFEPAKAYLDGIDVVAMDYQELMDEYKSNKKVVLLVDPPYLSTDCGAYENYWKLTDYLSVLNVLNDRPYFYFTSDKSELVELMEWLGKQPGGWSPFVGSTTLEVNGTVNYNSRYKDLMIFDLKP